MTNGCFYLRRGKSTDRPMRSKENSTTGPMRLSWQNYERQRRRLNARLGLTVFALLPLPAILMAVGLSPLRMLLVVASLSVSIGILYPLWWRAKHNPLRYSTIETRVRRVAWVCRPGGFIFGVTAAISSSAGGRHAELIGVAFGATAAFLLSFSYFCDKRAGQKLRSAKPLD
jgi:hypothetical protein